MYGFSERNVDVTNYSSVISSIAFSKCTKFFNNCLIELSLIITKSRAKLKFILSENYCISQEFVFNICTGRAEESGINFPGTLTMKSGSTSQAFLKVLTLIKSFDAGRTKLWHFSFSSLNCSFCPLLSTTSRRGSSADAREIKFFLGIVWL